MKIKVVLNNGIEFEYKDCSPTLYSGDYVIIAMPEKQIPFALKDIDIIETIK